MFSIFPTVADLVGGWAQVVIALGVMGGGLVALHHWLRRNIANPLKSIPQLIDQTTTLTQQLEINQQLLQKLTQRVDILEAGDVTIPPTFAPSLPHEGEAMGVALRAILEHLRRPGAADQERQAESAPKPGLGHAH